MYKTLLFDLDGTLTDPFEGITNSIVYSLSRFGISVADKRELIDFIGPPLVDSFKGFYGFSDKEAELAVEYYREYFSERGIFENAVYEGVTALLEALKRKGKKLLVATSKPEIFAERILHRFGLHGYFDYVAGATLDSTRMYKADVIAYALENAGIGDKTQVVMVGDRNHDILGAKKNGLASAGVLYGYGTLDELDSAGADYIFEKPSDILKLVK